LNNNNKDNDSIIFAIKEYKSINNISNFDYITEDRKIIFDKYNKQYVIKINPITQIKTNNNIDNIPYNDIYNLKLYKDNILYKEFNLTDKKLSYNKKKFEIKYKDIIESKYNVEIISIVQDSYEVNYVYYDNYTLDINKKRNKILIILMIVIPLILLIITGVIYIILKKKKKENIENKLNSTKNSDIFSYNSKKKSNLQESNDIINNNVDKKSIENDIN